MKYSAPDSVQGVYNVDGLGRRVARTAGVDGCRKRRGCALLVSNDASC